MGARMEALNDWVNEYQQLLSLLGTWLGALATFAAAGVALYLGLRPPRPRVSLSAGFYVLTGNGETEDVFTFQVTNHSDLAQTVTSIGLYYRRSFWLRRGYRHMVINHFPSTYDRGLPRVIPPANSENIMIYGDAFRTMVTDLSTGELKDLSWLQSRSLRFGAYLATGTMIAAPARKEFLDQLASTAKAITDGKSRHPT